MISINIFYGKISLKESLAKSKCIHRAVILKLGHTFDQQYVAMTQTGDLKERHQNINTFSPASAGCILSDWNFHKRPIIYFIDH